MGLPSPSSLLGAVQWLLDEWEERGRMEDAEAPSDNAVSSVTLTTTACTSNVLIMNFCQEISRGLFPVLGPASVAQAFCLHQSLLT